LLEQKLAKRHKQINITNKINTQTRARKKSKACVFSSLRDNSNSLAPPSAFPMGGP